MIILETPIRHYESLRETGLGKIIRNPPRTLCISHDKSNLPTYMLNYYEELTLRKGLKHST